VKNFKQPCLPQLNVSPLCSLSCDFNLHKQFHSVFNLFDDKFAFNWNLMNSHL
jgi:hypothetical protein